MTTHDDTARRAEHLRTPRADVSAHGPGGARGWSPLAVALGLLGLAGLALGSGMRTPAWGAVEGRHIPVGTAPLVFDGVTVIDVVQGRLLPDQRVVIVGTHIRTMGSASTVPLPAGARVVSARGKYLIPGLWDLHVHPTTYGRHHPDTHVRWHANLDIFNDLFIANGVTGIRNAGSSVPLDTMRLWRRQILASTRVGPPRQILSGPQIDEDSPCQRDLFMGGENHTCVIDEDDARYLVDSLKAAGADMIKTYDLSAETYFSIASEARKLGIPFGGHDDNKHTKIPAMVASDSGARILDHVNAAGNLDELCLGKEASVAQCQPVAEHFQRNNTWWVPTLIVEAAQTSSEEMRVGRLRIGKPLGPVSRAILSRFFQFAGAFWAGTEQRLTGLHEAASVGAREAQAGTADTGGTLHLVHRVGLPILAGTDVNNGLGGGIKRQPPGFCLHAELALYVAEGLTPLEALQAATLNPAKAFHLTDSLGTVAPGKLADLVLLDADPLQDITNTTTIRAVVANGRYFDRGALDQLVAEAQATGKQLLANTD